MQGLRIKSLEITVAAVSKQESAEDKIALIKTKNRI